MTAQSVSIPADSLLQHASFVRSLARDLLADEHLAEDVAQEAWLRYVARPPRSEPRNWLAVVVRNLARNARRSQGAREMHEERAARPEAISALDDDVAQAAALRSVVEAVLALDEPYRSTVIARYYRDAEPARIARESGVPVATVKSRLQRAHAQLRERLDREHGARANWVLALGTLAGFGETSVTGGSLTLLATTSKITGIAAALALTLFVAWRMMRVETAPSLGDPVASTTLAQEPAGKTAALDATIDERREITAPAPVPSATFRVAGSVRDLPYPRLALAGGPARDVELTLVLADTPNPGGVNLGRATLRSDTNGAFAAELPNPAQRPLWITLFAAQDQERRRIWFQTKVESGVDAREDLELTRAANGLLEGVIVDADGAPIPKAHARLVADQLRTDVAADEQGCLSVPWSAWLRSVVSLDAGASVLSWDAPRELDAGGWDGLRVVIGKSATLRVRVVDAQRRGLEGMQVTVALHESERRQLGSPDKWDTPRNFGRTDASGLIELTGVWADSKLKVGVSSDNDTHDTASARGDELDFSKDGVGAPIVLAAGEQRELVARWSGELRVAGRTLSTSGAPLADVLVQVWRRSDPRSTTYCLEHARSGSDGTFEASVRALDLDAGLRVVAGERASSAALAGGLGYVGGGAPTDGAVGEAEINASQAVDGVVHVDVTLRPTLTIAGRLLDGEGKPIARDGIGGVRMWTVPAGASSAREGFNDVGGTSAKIENDGRFFIFGLRPGAWDVYVAEQIQSFYTWDSFVHRFASITAGTQGVDLRLTRQGEVKIRVRLHGGEPDEFTVLHGELYPSDPSLARQPAPNEMHVDGATNWPVGAVLGFAGISGGRDELGTWSYGFYDTDEIHEHALQSMGPGWYVIGIHPSSKRGQEWFPQATEPRYFEPGEYAIDFELVPTTELTGRIRGDTRAEHLGVELRLANGARVPLESLPGFGAPRYVLETDALGRFIIRHAPVGRFTLRAGSLAELERGAFRREMTVDLAADATSSIEIMLP